MDDKFRCENCGGEFIKGRTDEEALAEANELFGDVPQEEQAVVCDDCFKLIMAQFN